MNRLVGIFILICFVLSSCRVADDTRDRVYEKKAQQLFLDGHRDMAVRFLDSVYASGYVSPLGRYITYSMKTNYFNHLGDHSQSVLYADSAIRVLKKNKLEHKYEKEYAHALLEKGHVYTYLNKYDSARASYMEGYAFVYATGNTCYLHEFDYCMGMMLYKQERMDQARIFFKRSFVEAGACVGGETPYYQMQEILCNIGLTFRDENDSCIYYIDSCLSFIETNKDRFHSSEMANEARAVCYMNRARAYMMLGRLDKAEEGIERTIGLYTAMDDKKYRRRIARARFALAMVLHDAKDSIRLVRCWNEIKPLMDTSTDLELRVTFSQLTHAMYAFKKDYKNAYVALEAFLQLTDSVKRNTHKDEQANMLQVMKNKEQEYKIGLLTRDSQLQRVYMWVAVALSGLAVIIVVLVYAGYQRTRRKNKLINDQKIALEKSNREKNKILNIVAHDLRSPVSAVAYLADSIIKDGEEASMDPLSALKLIKNSSLGSLQLIAELAVFARDEQQDLVLEKTSITGLIKDAVAMQAQKAAGKEVSVTVSVPAQEVEGKVDKNKVTRLVSNLLDNAIKFSAAGSGVHVVLQKDNDNISFYVQDAGIGIPPALLPRIFEMFTPVGRKGTRGEGSFGLGLSICRQIAEAHGGAIWVESTEGKGSTFYVRLPLL